MVKRYRTVIIVLLLIILCWSGLIEAYYFFDDFMNPSITSNEFDLGFKYGRGGITYCPSAVTTSISGGLLTLGGRVNNSDVSYIGTWVGRMVRYTNRQFTATEYNPFGVMIVRKNTRLDPQQEIATPNNPESWRHLNAMSFWFFVETGLNNSSPEGSAYNDFILMYEMMRDVFNTNNNGKPFSTWGKYISSESRFDLTSAIRADGQTSINIVNNTNYALEWCYENNYGAGTGDGALDGTSNNQSTNTNTIALMMTHNGSEVRFYINPNYNSDAGNPYPNEFLLLGSANVGWHSNISFMFGQEAKRYDTEMEYFQIDSVLIRSVASNSIAEIYPIEVVTNKQVEYTIIITNTFTSNDAGVGEVEIEKPDGFSSWNISSIKVFTYYGAGTTSTNIPTLKQLNNITTGTLASDGEVLIRTNGNKLKLQFCYGTPASSVSNVINYDTPDKRIEIHFILASPSAPVPDGSDFKVYVNCVKYNGSRYSRFATTGRMRSYAGDATGVLSTDRLNVKVYADTKAVASISPNEIYEGTDNLFYYYLSTESTNQGPYITRLEIEIPNGFTVSNNYLSSLKINNDANYVYVSNNKIIVDYAGDGSIFPAQSGLDRIDIKAFGTPDITSATTVQWKSIVYSSVMGSSPSYTTTNSSYKSQSVLIRLQPPNAEAYILPTLVYNNTKYNSYQYVVENKGDPGNKIQYIKIMLDSVFTNAANFGSSIGNSSCFTAVFGPTNYILVDYGKAGTNLDGGQIDTISFDLYDSVPSLSEPTNYSFPSYADNNNGDGFVAIREGTGGWQVDFVSPDPVGVGSIYKITNGATSTNIKSFYTSDISNTFQYKIQNAASADSENDIKIAKIVVPSSFTQIYNIDSTRIVNDAANISVISNEIIIVYTNDGNLPPGILDKVTFSVRDSITAPATYTFDLEVANGKNNFAWYSTGNLGAENKKLDSVYPPVMAKGFVRVDLDINNIIDSSTVTNSLTYYVTNFGDVGNDIKELRIYFPTNGSISECINIDSAIVTNSINERWVASGHYIFIDYANDGNLLTGKSNDVIHFDLVDNISVNTSFQIPISAKNDLETAYLPDVTGETQWVFVQVPPAYGRGKIYPNSIFVVPVGTTNTNILNYDVENYGTGSNSLKKIRISIPTVFANKVINVSSVHCTNDTTSITVNANYIEVDYTAENNPLPAGSTDTITFKLINDQTNTGSYTWNLEVDNGDGNGYVASSTISGGTKVLSVIRRAYCAISKEPNNYPSTVEVLTSITRSTLYYKINNSGGNLDIRKAKIIIPYPFITNNISVNPSYSGAPSATSKISNYSGTNVIIVNYASGDLPPGGANIIQIGINDNWTVGETNCVWNSFVDYNDGNGYVGTYVQTNNTTTVHFKFPPVYAKAYSTPNDVMIDKEGESYNITITNVDPNANKVQFLRIELPTSLTNITFRSSELIGTNIVYIKSNNKLLLNYQANGTNIGQYKKDTITIYAMDSVTSPITNQFILYAANSTNTNDFASVDVVAGKSLSLNFYKPNYKSAVYITPNEVNTVLSTNNLTYYIINTGSGTNNINKVKIYFATNIYITNNINVVPDRKCDIQIGGNYILLNYVASNTNIKPGDTGTVDITIIDKYKYGNTSVSWNSEVLYNTSFSNYKIPDVLSGESIDVAFQMPKPEAEVTSMSPDEVLVTENIFNLSINVTNRGKGSNDIFKLVIGMPSIFTQGINTNNLVTTLGYSKTYTNGEYTIMYTNFVPGKSDKIYINSLQTVNTSANFTLNFIASNSTYTTNVLGDTTFKIVTPPSAYVSPPEVFSTLESNTYEFYIKNNGTGSSNIKRAKIFYPDILTNITFYSSIKNGINNISINTSSNYFVIDYKTNGSEILPGEFDKLIIKAYDSIPYGYTNTSWDCLVDVGSGYVSTFTEVGQGFDVTYYMPQVDAAGYVNPNLVYTTDNSNRYTIYITNKGVLDNAILKARIYIPGVITNVADLSNNYNSSNQYIKASNLIIIDYLANNDKFKGQTKDVITFDGYKIGTSATDVSFRVYLYNGDTNGFVQIPVVSGHSFDVEIRFPNSMPKTYLDTPTIYTIRTQDTIVYKIRPGTEPVKQVAINFDTNLLNISMITSEYLADTFTNTNLFKISSNKITIVYSNSVTLSNEDTIKIDINYHLTQTTNIVMYAMVIYGTNTNIGIVPNGQTDILSIEKAPWGIVRGYIIPKYETINIKVFRSNENSVALDYEGKELSTYDDPATGYFEMEMIPPGKYNLVFESEKLKQYIYPFTMTSNTILSNIQIEMHNKPFNADASEVQGVTSYKDYKSSIYLPPGSIESDFSVDIYVEPITNYPNTLQPAFQSSSYIKKTSPNGVYVYRFDIRDLNEISLEGVALLKDGLLTLYYTNTLITKTGWDENNLGIYYFKDSTQKWIPIGGKVDTVNNTVTAHINYIAHYFGVFSKSIIDSKGNIINPIVSPRVFTPTRGGVNFNMVRFNFELKNPVDTVVVSIYDLKGNLIRRLERSGEYGQANIIWDGKDEDGVIVKSGVYIYRIKAGSDEYKGTVLVVK